MAENKKPQGKPSMQFIEDGIGIRLKAARESKGLSQTDLHKLTGLSRTVLINYEACRHIPGARELRLLCDALEVSPNQLIYGTEEPHRQTTGLADAILSMGASAVMPVMILAPMLGAMLGKDDTRAVLTMIESLLKAKSPDGYASVLELVRATKELSNEAAIKDPEKVKQLFSNDAEAQQFMQIMTQKIQDAKEKAKKL